MSAELRKVGDDLYFVEWGNVRFAGSAQGLRDLSRAITAGLLRETQRDRIVQRLKDRQIGIANGLDDGPENSIVRE